jgi:excisionase family DNA binding protein
MVRMEKLLLRPSEVAELIGLGRSKVYEMLASGELPVVRLGKCIRVPADRLRERIDEIVAKNNQKSA